MSLLEANFCKYGRFPIFKKVLDGEWPLVELLSTTECLCNCGKLHTWQCMAELHQKKVCLDAEDAAVFIRKNYTQLANRRNLVNELHQVATNLRSGVWVAAFHPLLCDVASIDLSDIPSDIAMIELGIAKIPPPITLNADVQLYFSLINADKRGRPFTIMYFGRYSARFPQIFLKALAKLPLELIVAIFEVTYNCNIARVECFR